MKYHYFNPFFCLLHTAFLAILITEVVCGSIQVAYYWIHPARVQEFQIGLPPSRTYFMTLLHYIDISGLLLINPLHFFNYFTRCQQSIPPRRYTTINHSMSTRLADLLLCQAIMSCRFKMDSELRAATKGYKHRNVHQRPFAKLESRARITGEAHLRDVLLACAGEYVGFLLLLAFTRTSVWGGYCHSLLGLSGGLR